MIIHLIILMAVFYAFKKSILKFKKQCYKLIEYK